MKDLYLTNLEIKGIKSLNEVVSLSFYKKTISNCPDTKDYNVKGIYGMNGSGKSGIVTAVKILKHILVDSTYLNNPIVQKNLDEMINKREQALYVKSDYMVNIGEKTILFAYTMKLSKNTVGKYSITYEQLSCKNVVSRSGQLQQLFEIENGEVVYFIDDDLESSEMLRNKTVNLLSTASLSALFQEKIVITIKNKEDFNGSSLFVGLLSLLILGNKIHVYMEPSDKHREYFMRKSFDAIDNNESVSFSMDTVLDNFMDLDGDNLNVISIGDNIVPDEMMGYFGETVHRLYSYLRIFKEKLKDIEIDKKRDRDAWICNLVMVYEDYKISTEFESTGVKKLIRLFAYLREMVNGGIVFIDEFDSNLHDVYLCALLEYLMEYGEGQLCFTTHNVGPMDVLRQRKKSIDFLSEDHRIYPWIKKGNYSPAKLYRNGMIEGSPFNVDSIDFIGILDYDREDME